MKFKTKRCEWCDAVIDAEICGLLCVDCDAIDRKHIEQNERDAYLRGREDDWAIDAARGK
jgi:hypothetical protein